MQKFIFLNRATTLYLIFTSLPRFESAKKDILNFINDEFETVDTETRAMAKLTRECLISDYKSVVVSENVKRKLISYLHRSAIVSITSISRSKLPATEYYSLALQSREKYFGQHYYRFMWKSSGFLLSLTSPVNMKQELDNLRNSRWWNSAGYFIFVDVPHATQSADTSCFNAYDFLSLAWRYELLSSVYLCSEQNGSLSIYSYDPYGYSAPQPWIKSREMKGQHGHPWTLFKWKNHDGRDFDCKSIFFDKTKSLNGYPMTTHAVAVPPYLNLVENTTAAGIQRYIGQDAAIMKVIWAFLDASIIDVPLSAKTSKALGWVDDNGTFHGNLIDIVSGRVEIGLNSMMLQPSWKIATSYPHTSSRICFVTKDRGALPWLIGLIFVFDKWTIILTVLVIFFATIAFGYFDDSRYCSGFLNTFRIFISASTLYSPRLDSFRIILCAVFLLPIVFNSIFQGNVLSFLRNPLRYANIDDLNELPLLGFKIEGSGAWRKFIPIDKIGTIYVPITRLDSCLKKLHKNERVACASLCLTLLLEATKDKSVHVSIDRSSENQNQFVAKPDWPLMDRFNVVLQRMVQAGLIDVYVVEGSNEESSSSLASNYFGDSSGDTAIVIRLREFRYVFVGLAIGWACGTIIFICELLRGRLKRLRGFKIRIIRA